jgi:hypothetical protein
MREDREKWMELCEQAADEQDPKKLAVLILQINYILEAKELRLTGKAPAQPAVEADSVGTWTATLLSRTVSTLGRR